jgi:hypothetical protein
VQRQSRKGNIDTNVFIVVQHASHFEEGTTVVPHVYTQNLEIPLTSVCLHCHIAPNNFQQCCIPDRRSELLQTDEDELRKPNRERF